MDRHKSDRFGGVIPKGHHRTRNRSSTMTALLSSTHLTVTVKLLHNAVSISILPQAIFSILVGSRHSLDTHTRTHLRTILENDIDIIVTVGSERKSSCLTIHSLTPRKANGQPKQKPIPKPTRGFAKSYRTRQTRWAERRERTFSSRIRNSHGSPRSSRTCPPRQPTSRSHSTRTNRARSVTVVRRPRPGSRPRSTCRTTTRASCLCRTSTSMGR